MAMTIPFSWLGPRPTIESYNFDPKGDILLKLIRRYEKAEPQDEPDSESSSISGNDEDADTDNFPGSDNVSAQEDTTINEHRNVEGDAMSVSETSIALLKDPVYMRVSSRHLILASRVFGAMLDDSKFKEGITLHLQGSVEIELPDDDPDAFNILFNILHGRTRDVPRKLSLATLTQIAILVNKYELLIPVEIFSDIWIRRLSKRGWPEKFLFEREDVLGWLFISWVFEKPEIFKEMSRVLIRQATHTLLEQDMDSDPPIPHTFLEIIQERRLEALDALLTIPSSLITKYTHPLPQCAPILSTTNPDPADLSYAYACDSMFLGSLVKSCSNISIFPLPQTPFNDISVDGLAEGLRGMQLKSKCDGNLKGYVVSHACHGEREMIKESVRRIVDGVSGLELKDFKKMGAG